MKNDILQQIADYGIKFKFLPIEYLAYIKADIFRFRKTENLNEFQKWIIDDRYVLDVPELAFDPKTIIVTAVKFNLVNVIFNYGGKGIKDIFCVKRKGIKDFMNKLFSQNEYNIEYIHWLPQKRFAVCSGLAEYGRNNITYIDGWGSIFELQTYVTDMPCEQNNNWRDVKCMDICGNCEACIRNCPTKSIKENRYLIDNEICLSRLSELETPFPDWLPKHAHHSVYGCYKCQNICPPNIDILSNIAEIEYFNEAETEILLKGIDRDSLPGHLVEKIERIGAEDYHLKRIPKNLKALFGIA